MKQRGMVTAELALGLIALVLAVTAALGAVGVALVQAQCWDTASEVARQVARGDRAGVEAARRDVPPGGAVQIDQRGEAVEVTATALARPWGVHAPSVRLSARARVLLEPGVRP